MEVNRLQLTSNPKNWKVAGHRNAASILLPYHAMLPWIAEPSGYPVWRDSLEARAYGTSSMREAREVCYMLLAT